MIYIPDLNPLGWYNIYWEFLIGTICSVWIRLTSVKIRLPTYSSRSKVQRNQTQHMLRLWQVETLTSSTMLPLVAIITIKVSCLNDHFRSRCRLYINLHSSMACWSCAGFKKFKIVKYLKPNNIWLCSWLSKILNSLARDLLAFAQLCLLKEPHFGVVAEVRVILCHSQGHGDLHAVGGVPAKQTQSGRMKRKPPTESLPNEMPEM